MNLSARLNGLSGTRTNHFRGATKMPHGSKPTNQIIITMHSRIYEIDAKIIESDDWAGESTIANEHGEIEGVDYYREITDENERCEYIENFFTKWFPDNSFKIVSNVPGQTAVVRFVGDIKALYQKWMDEIKARANELTIEEMNRLDVFRVRMACEEPFDLSSKFYMENWTGCTSSADDFLSYLRYLDEKNEGKHFLLYVGQVFDYHF